MSGERGANGSFIDACRDAARFWEPRRILYNLILTGVAFVWFAGTWPHFRGALTLESLVALIALACIANLLYGAAYLIDIPLRRIVGWTGSRRSRWLLWSAGMFLAVLLENYWIADEIYPYVPLVR